MDGINRESQGPRPEKLAVKVGGTLPCELDMRRTQEVQVILEGKVVGHGFKDTYDKHGDYQETVKTAIIQVDEMISCEVITRAKVSNAGQQAMDVDAEPVTEPADGEAREEIVDAEIVAELEPGPRPDGVDENGEIAPDAPTPELPEGESAPEEASEGDPPPEDIEWEDPTDPEEST